MNKEKNFISAVIYVHNESGRIGQFLETIIDVLEEHFEHSEIICVNDYSTDDSVQEIQSASQKAAGTSVSVLNMSCYHGIEIAMNAGVDLAIGDFVFEFDIPFLDYDKNQIMAVYMKSVKEGYDIVSASPDKKQKASSNLFYRIFNRFTDYQYKLGTESFRILSRRVINRISSMNKTVLYRKVLYASCGLKTANIVYPCIAQDAQRKSDKKESRYRSALAVDSLVLFTDLGYKFSVTMTSVMIFIAAFMAVYSVVIFLLGNPVAGWTTTILFLSLCFLGLFGILSIIVKYLQMIVNLVFKRKKYNFESVQKLTK